jgi:hypothetical protein
VSFVAVAEWIRHQPPKLDHDYGSSSLPGDSRNEQSMEQEQKEKSEIEVIRELFLAEGWTEEQIQAWENDGESLKTLWTIYASF